MGTSVSHRSPETHNWRAVAASYISDNIPINIVSREIWRAAINQPAGNLPLSLAEPIVANCLRMVLGSASPQEASRNISRLIVESGATSLATDIARRAAITCFNGPENRRQSFVSDLFSGVMDYLVSRDISSYVGKGERIRNVSSSIAFKASLKEQVKNIIDDDPVPENIENNLENWKNFVISKVQNLAGIKR